MVNINYALTWFFLGLLLSCAMMLAQRILFAIAVYFDAMANEIESPMLWTLLVGFLGLIPGLIYLFSIRKSAHMAKSESNSSPMAEEYAKRAKQQLKAACITLGIGLFAFVLCLVVFFMWMLPIMPY